MFLPATLYCFRCGGVFFWPLHGKQDMEVMVLSYGVIMFIFLLALVPAVATHNFNGQSKKRYARSLYELSNVCVACT